MQRVSHSVRRLNSQRPCSRVGLGITPISAYEINTDLTIPLLHTCALGSFSIQHCIFANTCDRWAFVDFVDTEGATAALTNPRNHHLDGRNLVVEYASPDAVRRGGHRPAPGEKPQARDKDRAGRAAPPSRKRAHDDADAGQSARRTTGRDAAVGDADADADAAGAGGEGAGARGRPAKRPRVARGEPARRGKGGARWRAKPGAALAQATREAVAIVPSRGRKIVF